MNNKLIKILKEYNLIDLISLGIFFFTVATIGIFFLRRSQYVSILLRVSNTDQFQDTWSSKPTEWFIEELKIGLQAKDYLGRTNVEITDVYYYPSNYNEETIFARINIRTVYNKNKNQYSYNGVPLLIGSYQTLELGNLKINGVIYKVGENKPETKVFKVSGEIKNKYNEEIEGLINTTYMTGIPNIAYEGIPEYIYSKIDNNIITTNSKGQPILKVTSLELLPAYKEFVTANSVKKSFDSERKKVMIDANILTTKVNDTYLFREQNSIIIGNNIPIHIDNISLFLTIMDVEEVTDKESIDFFD